MAQRVLLLGEGLSGGRASILLRAEYSRLQGMPAAARGQDPEADLRAAAAAHEA